MGGRGQQGRAPPSTPWCMLGAGLSLMLGSWTGTPHRERTDWDPSEETRGHQSVLSQGVMDEEGTRWRCTRSPLGSLSRVTEEETRAEKSHRHQGQGQPQAEPQMSMARMLRAVTHPDAQWVRRPQAPGSHVPTSSSLLALLKEKRVLSLRP